MAGEEELWELCDGRLVWNKLSSLFHTYISTNEQIQRIKTSVEMLMRSLKGTRKTKEKLKRRSREGYKGQNHEHDLWKLQEE